MISDEAVEAAAREIYRVAAVFAYEPETWGELGDGQRHAWTEDAKRILEAAAPHIAAEATDDALRAAWDRGYATATEGMKDVAADAWDEAYDKGFEAARGEPDTTNPYRSQA